MISMQTAIEYLDAIRADDGTYSYKAAEVGRWVHKITAEDMLDLAGRLEACPSQPKDWHETPDHAYSLWCAESSSGEIDPN